jgi:uncharacterized protein YeaO (DUF488 family)
MAISVVRLGTARHRDEGLRIGTVRRPPRGVPKADFARRNFYDVWLPQLAPSAELVEQAQAADSDAAWRAFERRYRAELKQPDTARLVQLLAAMSHATNFSIGCYCEDERRCHRSILRRILEEVGGRVNP